MREVQQGELEKRWHSRGAELTSTTRNCSYLLSSSASSCRQRNFTKSKRLVENHVVLSQVAIKTPDRLAPTRALDLLVTLPRLPSRYPGHNHVMFAEGGRFQKVIGWGGYHVTEKFDHMTQDFSTIGCSGFLLVLSNRVQCSRDTVMPRGNQIGQRCLVGRCAITLGICPELTHTRAALSLHSPNSRSLITQHVDNTISSLQYAVRNSICELSQCCQRTTANGSTNLQP